MKFSLLFLISVALLCNSITAAVIEARGKHPSHPSSSSRHGRANACKDHLNGHPKAQAKKFCIKFLNGRKPASASTITQTSTTTPVTVTVSGTVVQTTLPDVYTTTTSVTTIESTVTTPEARRRSLETSAASLDKRGFSEILKQFPKEVVTDACLLYLYGQLDAPAVRTTTVVTAATSTSTSISTSVHTNPPTTTSTVTVSSSTTSYTSVAPAPTELIKAGDFETTEPGNGPRFQNVPDGDWILEGNSQVIEDATLAASGKRFLSLIPSSSTGATTFGAARINYDGMVVGKQYTVTYKRRFVTIDTVYPNDAYCGSGVSVNNMQGGTGNERDYERLTAAGGGYVDRTFTFTATATTAQLRAALVAYYGTSCKVYYDDFSILRSG